MMKNNNLKKIKIDEIIIEKYLHILKICQNKIKSLKSSNNNYQKKLTSKKIKCN